MIDPCECGHAEWSAPAHQRQALAHVGHADAIGDLLEVVARDDSRWLRVLRCVECGRLWAEDSMSSGHASLFFVYPISADDAEAWLAQASPLELPPGR